MLTHVTLKYCLYCVKCSKKAHNKQNSAKQQIQMVWFYAEAKSILLTRTKFVKHFDLDCKHVKPSKQTILAVINNFLETWSVLDVPRSVKQKTGRSTANIDAIRHAILKSPKKPIRRLSAEHTVGRTHSEEIKSSQLFAERFKEVLLQDTSKTKDQGSLQRARITFCNWILVTN